MTENSAHCTSTGAMEPAALRRENLLAHLKVWAKAGGWYTLRGGEFVEVAEQSGTQMDHTPRDR